MKLALPETMIGPVGVATGTVVELAVIPALVVETVVVRAAALFAV